MINSVSQATETYVVKAGTQSSSGVDDADPVKTEIIRQSPNSAANQMKRALIRTAFSPTIYEVLDFAVAIYDNQVRLLARPQCGDIEPVLTATGNGHQVACHFPGELRPNGG